jgi:hypothetical protein
VHEAVNVLPWDVIAGHFMESCPLLRCILVPVLVLALIIKSSLKECDVGPAIHNLSAVEYVNLV